MASILLAESKLHRRCRLKIDDAIDADEWPKGRVGRQRQRDGAGSPLGTKHRQSPLRSRSRRWLSRPALDPAVSSALLHQCFLSSSCGWPGSASGGWPLIARASLIIEGTSKRSSSSVSWLKVPVRLTFRLRWMSWPVIFALAAKAVAAAPYCFSRCAAAIVCVLGDQRFPRHDHLVGQIVDKLLKPRPNVILPHQPRRVGDGCLFGAFVPCFQVCLISGFRACLASRSMAQRSTPGAGEPSC